MPVAVSSKHPHSSTITCSSITKRNRPPVPRSYFRNYQPAVGIAEMPLRHAEFSKPYRQINRPIVGNEAAQRTESREHNLSEPRNYIAVDLIFILRACFTPGKRLIYGKQNLR